MPRVNLDHCNTSLLRFVGNEIVQLGKYPTMQPSLIFNVLVLFASSHLGSLTDLREIFQDDGTTRSGILDDALGKYVITIPVESLLSFPQLLEMLFSRLTSVGLQFSLETEGASVNLFPITMAKELTLARDSRAVETQVNPDHFIALLNDRLSNGDHDMQPPFALTRTQISCSDLPTVVFSTIGRNCERNTLLTSTGRETYRIPFPVKGIGMQVIAD